MDKIDVVLYFPLFHAKPSLLKLDSRVPQLIKPDHLRSGMSELVRKWVRLARFCANSDIPTLDLCYIERHTINHSTHHKGWIFFWSRREICW